VVEIMALIRILGFNVLANLFYIGIGQESITNKFGQAFISIHPTSQSTARYGKLIAGMLRSSYCCG
jgi:hypothetical protein